MACKSAFRTCAIGLVAKFFLRCGRIVLLPLMAWTSVLSALFSNLSAQAPLPPITNPNLNLSCPYDIILVLDESGSITGTAAGATDIAASVRSGARGMIAAMNGTGTRAVVVEFNTNARLAVIGGATGYQTVTSIYVNAFNNYINPDADTAPSASNYDPEDYSCPGSQCHANWEEAFAHVQNINTTLGLADLVVFFSDGAPTAYVNAAGGVTYGTDATVMAQSLAEATTAANMVKLQGSHIFAVGLANPTLPETHLWQIAGPDKYPLPVADFTKGDYTISTAATLQQDLSGIPHAVCNVDIRLNKTASRQTVCPGENVVFTLTAYNEGIHAGSNIIVRDVIPSGYTYVNDNGGTATIEAGGTLIWNVGTLQAGTAKAVQITVTANPFGNYRNTAQVIVCAQKDMDSAPNNDDGDQSEDDEAFAIVSLVSPLSCADGNPCSIDQCFNGRCVYTFLNCNDGDPCTLDACASDACSHLPIIHSVIIQAVICDNEHYFAGGTLRNTSGTYVDSLTTASGCDSVVTTILTVLPTMRKVVRIAICPGDSVYAAGAYRKQGGTYYDTLVADNGCDSILTTVVVIPSCNDVNSCTDDYCHDAVCHYLPKNCDDGDACTADGCQGGVCFHQPLDCNDGNPCTTDGCAGGCYHQAMGCDDHDPCTTDSCDSSCFHVPLNCDDGDPCTADGCDSGCFHVPLNCDDGNPCTIDRCSAGCFHQPVNCDDGIICTWDTCTGEVCNHFDIPVQAAIAEKATFCQGATTSIEAVFADAVSYLWSTGETTATIEASADNAYAVTVTDDDGCEGTASFTAGIGDIFTAYTILAAKKVSLNLNTVYSGGVGVMEAAGSAALDSSIADESFTFVRAASIILTGTSSVAQPLPGPAAVVMPPFENNPYPPPASLNIPAGSVVTLSDSVYGSISIGKASAVTFTSANIYARSIVTKEKVTMRFAPCTRIRVSNKVSIGRLNVFNPDGYDVIVYSGFGFKIDQNSVVTADIYVKSGNLIVGAATAAKPNFLTGSFIATEVHAGAFTYWYWNTECAHACEPQPAYRVAYTGAEALEKTDDDAVRLKAFPNPFSRTLNIEFSVSSDSETALLDIFNISGQKIATLFKGELKAFHPQTAAFHPQPGYGKIFIYRLQTIKGVRYGKAVME